MDSLSVYKTNPSWLALSFPDTLFSIKNVFIDF